MNATFIARFPRCNVPAFLTTTHLYCIEYSRIALETCNGIEFLEVSQCGTVGRVQMRTKCHPGPQKADLSGSLSR